MNEQDIIIDRETINAASPGPWQSGADPCHFDSPEVTGLGPRNEGFSWYISTTDADARFIAQAKTRWPAALDAVENLKVETKALKVAHDELYVKVEETTKALANSERARGNMSASIARLLEERDAPKPPQFNTDAGTIAELRARVAHLEQANGAALAQADMWKAAVDGLKREASLGYAESEIERLSGALVEQTDAFNDARVRYQEIVTSMAEKLVFTEAVADRAEGNARILETLRDQLEVAHRVCDERMTYLMQISQVIGLRSVDRNLIDEVGEVVRQRDAAKIALEHVESTVKHAGVW